jgi:fatty-acyl-CoA synthase
VRPYPLHLGKILSRSATYFPNNEIVSRERDGSRFRYTYRQFNERVRRIASILKELGVQPGDRVATFAWNHYRHLELYFAIPSSGAVLHTVNIRLAESDVAYILNHAEDRVVFVDPDLIPVMENIAPQLKTVQAYVVMDDSVPDTSLRPAYAYEKLMDQGDPQFAFSELDENTPAGMCYTSATTGRPKGVMYTHRTMCLHASSLCYVDTLGIREAENLLPVVPMFHVNSWGLPFAGVSMGAKMILPGPRPNAEDLLQLVQEEKATFMAAAVTIGIDMLNVLERHPYDISSLRALMLGGQATPKAVMEKYLYRYGVPIFTAWGATETSPIATVVHIKRHQQSLTDDQKIDIRVRQGIPVLGVEVKVVDEEGKEVSWDDHHMGEIYVRGLWVATGYYNYARTKDGFVDGWWKSGDIATVNEEGVLRLVDRAKDMIKSGGEWISSVELENALMAHPKVLEAAVIAVPHEKWVERPVACVVPGVEPGKELEEELTEWLRSRFAKWWLPDRYIFVAAIPKTGVGKFNKRLMREQFKNILQTNS